MNFVKTILKYVAFGRKNLKSGNTVELNAFNYFSSYMIIPN